MHIRTFRAASLQAALEEIRRQMGPDASVLHTRQVRDGWMGWLGRTHVEVTAGLRDENDPQPPLPVPEPSAGRRDVDARLPDAGDAASAPRSAQNAWGLEAAPAGLRDCYRELLRAGVAEGVARHWIETTSGFPGVLGEDDPATSWPERVQATVARELKLAGPIRTQPGARHVVALVGPTGVGKTTTIAKLAAGFRIEARRRVGLLTIDTFRIAAVQQLKAYAEIMDLPMEVVERAGEMQPALDRLGDVDLVLIDTAGRSPRSDARIEQLVELLKAAQPDETHLVLSATGAASTIHAALEGFAPVRPTAAILTKLDETPHTAGVLSALSAAASLGGIPLSYVTNGQQVPDDIELADAERLVARLLPSRLAASHLEAA